MRATKERIGVPVRFSVSLGMIVNELVTNAVKYAFNRPSPAHPPTSTDAPPEISVTLGQADDGSISAVIADNGPGFDDAVIRHQIALINSMTKKERANPQILQASRKKRIAAGAGLEVSDLNKLLKMQRQMADAMKKLGKMGKKGMLKGGLGALMGKGTPEALQGMDPAGMDPAAMEKAARQMGMGGLGGMGGGLPPGLGGFGKKK
ncbi:MAG: ATP-binding protein [Spirochaetota bacterium]